jgi:hypothetical protein
MQLLGGSSMACWDLGSIEGVRRRRHLRRHRRYCTPRYKVLQPPYILPRTDHQKDPKTRIRRGKLHLLPRMLSHMP